MSPDTIAMIEGLAKLGAMVVITSEDGQFYVAIAYEAIGSARADTIDAAFAEAKRMFRHDLEARYHARKAGQPSRPTRRTTTIDDRSSSSA